VHQLDPINVWGHDHCWWLDRMVRSDQQLIERMTLVWHSLFATSIEASNAQLMIRQNNMMRSRALGNFHDLLVLRGSADGDPADRLLRGVAPREGVAREWDRRMPVPAGAGVDRRRFLLGAGGGLLSVYGAGRLGLTSRVLGEGVARAAATQGPASPVLVSVFLQGGIDSLSLLAPVDDPLYRKLRPTLAVSPSAGLPFAEDARLRWHPAAASLAKLHDAGKLTVFPGIGYTSPDMSHFTSRHYWEVGATETQVVTGWLGRYLDAVGNSTNPLQGLSMDGQMNPTLATARTPVAAIDKPEDFSLWLDRVWGDVFTWTLASVAADGDARERDDDRRVARADAARLERQPARERRLPRRVLLAARAVVRR
jgi:hypothetical protein